MIKTVLFDLDGTIIDTNELIVASYLHTLKGVAEEPFTREQIVPNMGRPLFEQLKLFSGRDEVDDLVAKYREYNLSRHDEMVREFPHVREVLRQLKEMGIRLGIVTSKVRKTTMMGLKLCGIEPYMDAVVTVNDVKQPKPDPEGIFIAMKALEAKPLETMMVGDSHYDIEAARNAGVMSVGVAWSLKGESYLHSYRPDAIVHDMRELLDLVGAKRDAH